MSKYYERTTGEKTLDAIKRDLFVSMVTTLSTDEDFAQIFEESEEGAFSKFVENQLSVLDSTEFTEADRLLGIKEDTLPFDELVPIEAFKLNYKSGDFNKTQINNQMKSLLERFKDSPNFEEIDKIIKNIVTPQ